MTDSTDTKEPPHDPRDLVLAILIGVLITPFTGMVYALACRLLWGWFVAPQYGDGPTLETWFGVSALYGVIVAIGQARHDSAKPLPSGVIGYVVKSATTGLMLLGVAIAAAAMARVIWGWR